MHRRRIALVAFLIALLAICSPQTASAHAFLTSSSPADGSSLAAAPRQLRLDFSETVVLAATQLDLVSEDGRRYPVSGLRIEGEGGEEPARLLATLPVLPKGAYRLSWQTLSADDLHRTAGVLVFGVGRQVDSAGLIEPKPAAGESGLRWLVFLSLAFSLGGALLSRLLTRPAGPTAPDWLHLARRSQLAGAVGGLLGSLLLLEFQLRGGASTSLLAGQYGVRWGLREAGFGLLLAASVLGVSRIRTSALVLGAVLVGCGAALLGHSGASSPPSYTRVVADTLHLLAASAWAGALVIVLVYVTAATRHRHKLPAAMTVLRAFGLPAALCISVVISTGIYLSSGVIGSVDAALATWYGRTLLLKVGVVAVIGVLGVVNHRRLRRTASLRRGTILAEAALAVAVLGLSGLITSGQPALEPQLVRDPAAVAVPLQDARVADLQQTLAVRPNAPGRNLVMVEVFDTRRPAPAPVRTVTIGLVDADGTTQPPVAAQRLPDGRWSAPVVLAGSGSAHVVVSVQRTGLPAAVHTYRWVVSGDPATARTELVSTRPLRNWLLLLWLAVTIVIGAGWWIFGVSRIGAGSETARELVEAPGGAEDEAVLQRAGTVSR
ncbi:copper transport protein [Kribbella voronezhensis]|uniref:Copper transport protein n=1 Tax=Kribbella voronezhensis TaxID=2512212 RepID=A0A4R7SWS8_9ACTN|nr:copper resistance protein CopC [Kribbella voronezhensis]TDU83309.1 copper transport protein [Kribbella voronezhensis]